MAFRRSKAAAAPVLDDSTVHTLAVAVAEHLKATGAGQPVVEDTWGGMFPPGIPLRPVPLDPREPTAGGPYDPVRTQVQSGVNLILDGGRFVPFQILREVAERVDVLRRCVEVRKSQLLALDWDITLSKSALKRIMTDEGISSPGKAQQFAREKFEPDMARLREWWEKPDQYNGMDFSAWLGALLEDHFVIDAVAIWPRKNLGGDVIAAELINGATIKPLLDRRGSTPLPPEPAFQQIIHGFPRGQWTASNDAAGEYASGPSAGIESLVYRPRYRRTWTPYGLSNVEQALLIADVYLKRMDWIRQEFDAGSTPDTWMKSDLKAGQGKDALTPEQLASYQQFLNAELAGQTTARKSIRLLPAGMDPVQMSSFSEKYTTDLDEILIKLMCMCFDVMPTEIGFPPKSGIGGKGHQEGEANSTYRKAIRPSVVWLAGLLTDFSRTFLQMPSVLAFSFLGYEVEDQTEEEKKLDSEVRGGRATINEARAATGKPLFPFPEADEPFIVGPSGLVFLDGSKAALEAAPAAPPHPPGTAQPAQTASAANTAAPAVEVEPPPDGKIRVTSHLRSVRTAPQQAEAGKFLAFLRNRTGRPWRDFEFAELDPTLGAHLNRFAELGNLDAARDLLKVATPKKVTKGTRNRLVDAHAAKIATAVRALFPSSSAMRDAWAAHEASTKAPTEAERASQTLVRRLMGDPAPVTAAFKSLAEDGHAAGYSAVTDEDPDEQDEEEGSGGSHRLRTLMAAAAPVAAAALVASVAGLVASALRSDDPDAIDRVLSDDTWATTAASVELTASLSAGTLDGCAKVDIAHVRLVVSGDECEFCQGYDGRIMTTDEDGGMPPLHRGCVCDIEPLP